MVTIDTGGCLEGSLLLILPLDLQITSSVRMGFEAKNSIEVVIIASATRGQQARGCFN